MAGRMKGADVAENITGLLLASLSLPCAAIHLRANLFPTRKVMQADGHQIPKGNLLRRECGKFSRTAQLRLWRRQNGWRDNAAAAAAKEVKKVARLKVCLFSGRRRQIVGSGGLNLRHHLPRCDELWHSSGQRQSRCSRSRSQTFLNQILSAVSLQSTSNTGALIESSKVRRARARPREVESDLTVHQSIY